MRRKLRELTVSGRTYLWSYNYDEKDCKSFPIISYLLLVPADNRRLTVRVYFKEYQPEMALGVPNIEAVNCTFKGEDAVLNLNRPSCAAMVAGYVFSKRCDPTETGEKRIDDGDAVLRALGYEGFEHPKISG